MNRRSASLLRNPIPVLLLLLAVSVPASAEVLKIVVNDTIHPITNEYIGRALAEVFTAMPVVMSLEPK